MAIKLPQAAYSDAPQRKKREIPLQAIVEIMGNNPLAQGIDQVGATLSQALARRGELRKQAQQVAKLEELAGREPGSLSGLPLETASSMATLGVKTRMEAEEAERKKTENLAKIRALETQFKYKTGDLGDDLDAAKTRVYHDSIGNRQDKTREAGQDDKFKNRLNNQKNRMVNDPRIKPLHAQDIGLRQVGEIQGLVQGGNTVAAGALGVKMAKAMGEVGVLTDQDVARYVVSGRLDRMAADKLSKWTRGVPSNATQQEIAQIASVLRDSFSEKIQPVYNEYIESFSEVEGLTPDEVSRKMGIPYKPSAALQPLPTPGPQPLPSIPQVGGTFNGQTVTNVRRKR